MKANELRIGNLVYDRGNKILKIDYWERKDMIAQEVVVVEGFVGHPLTEDVEFLKPIPLTEEWLLKFGFKETNDNDFIGGLYTRGKDGFYINKETMSYCGIDYEGTIDDIVEINYVHELQNLYFVLTKQELTMK